MIRRLIKWGMCPTHSQSARVGSLILSGSHLMIVLAGTIADTTAISWGVLAVCAGLPQWVLDKIYPMTDSYVDKKAFDIFGSDLTTQSLNVWLRKSTSLFLSANALTLSADRSFRISFDLLIDQLNSCLLPSGQPKSHLEGFSMHPKLKGWRG